jgi:hypothetical protein
MQPYQAEGYGRMSVPFLVLTHYILYYDIKPADELRVTSATIPASLRPRKNSTTGTWTRQVGP